MPSRPKDTGPVAAAVQSSLCVDVIKQYPGPQQVKRAVKVGVPGKHFPNLTPSQ